MDIAISPHKLPRRCWAKCARKAFGVNQQAAASLPFFDMSLWSSICWTILLLLLDASFGQHADVQHQLTDSGCAASSTLAVLNTESVNVDLDLGYKAGVLQHNGERHVMVQRLFLKVTLLL